MTTQTTKQIAEEIVNDIIKDRPLLIRAKRWLDKNEPDRQNFAEEFLKTFRESLAHEVEGGWVIEHHASPTHTPNYFAGWNDGGKDWDTDNLKAVRFAREQDARTVSEFLEQLEDSRHKNRVAYHEWG